MCPYFTMRIWVILLFCTIEDCCIWNSGIGRIALINQTKQFAYMNQIQYHNRQMECMDQNGTMPKQCPHARAMPHARACQSIPMSELIDKNDHANEKCYLKLMLLITLMLLKTNWQKRTTTPTDCYISN